jgi:tRNA-Thr(GGU) m(6)t(6)A37 methyltransferase TsaA
VDTNAGFVVHAIGVVASPRDEAIDDDWGAIDATITLRAPYDEASVRGLDAFSHVDVVFLFDRVAPDAVQTGARVPRNNPAWPEVGIFAQRAKMRPNRIAVTTCELVAVEGASLRVRGLDAIDGTPVLDLKPYMAEFGARGEVRQPEWSHELMAGYW